MTESRKKIIALSLEVSQLKSEIRRLTEVSKPVRITTTKERWVLMVGGQAMLDREGFEVVPCGDDCTDTVCHGWKVQLKPQQPMGVTP